MTGFVAVLRHSSLGPELCCARLCTNRYFPLLTYLSLHLGTGDDMSMPAGVKQ